MNYKRGKIKKEMICTGVTLFLLIFGGVFGLFEKKEEKLYVLERPAWQEGAKEEVLLAEDEEGQQQEIRITLRERRYTEAEIEKFLEEAESYVKLFCLGENKSWDAIRENLSLESTVPELPVEVSWDLGESECFDRQGRLLLEKVPENGMNTVITAVLFCQEKRKDVDIPVKILPPLWTKQELWRQQLEKQIQEKERLQPGEQRIELPFEEGMAVAYYPEKTGDGRGKEWILFSLAAGMLVYVALRKEERNREENRRKKLLEEYPALVEKLLLFLRAGMSVRNCFFRLKEEAGGQALEKELWKVCQELKNGGSEREAYLHFGERIALLPYIRLGTLLSQNLRSGTAEILEFLERELQECFLEKRARVKKQGEEIEVKLLLPMGLLLLLTLGIIMIPAFLQF